MPGGKRGKKKGGGATKKKTGSQAANVPSSSAAANDSLPSSSLKGEIPNLSELHSINESTHQEKNNHTVYSRYKVATKRFLDYMCKYCPQEDKTDKGVNFLFSAVNLMVETKHLMEPAVLSDLKLSILLRSRVASSVFGGGDVGHKYFLQALIYCWSILNSLPKKESKNNTTLDHGYDKENAFAILEVDGDNAEQDEDIFPMRPIQRPKPLDTPIAIEEILASEDRTDSIIFLNTLDELMKAVSALSKQQTESIQYARQDVPMSFLIYTLMETAVTANMAIQQVQQLEMELQAHHEHLTTPYRLLATIIMPNVTLNVMSIVRDHAAKKCSKRDVTSFLGDCMECYFRNVSDEHNKSDTIVNDFCAKFQVDAIGRSEFEQHFSLVEVLVKLEVPLMCEKNEHYIHLQQLTRQGGMSGKSHEWLSGLNNIGGARSIHHTIRLLQMFGSVISSTPIDIRLEPKRGSFGRSPWQAGISETIHGDLDELLMSDIVPNWVVMVRHGILGRVRLPFENEVCPLFGKIREYVEHSEKAVTWSLAFGVHAMLTSILIAGPYLDQIMTVSKTTYEQYFEQVRSSLKLVKKKDEITRSACWKHNTSLILFLENFGLDVFGEHMIWNPLWGGTAFSIVCNIGNLCAGCTLIDCQAQLRISLYLYHGLLINDIIKEGDAPLLDILYEAFKESKAIWEGSLPRRGELVKRFWICFGMSLIESKRMAEKAQTYANQNIREFTGIDCDTLMIRGRKMHPIDPGDIATSFRRICYRDFHDIVDKYHTPEQRKLWGGTDQYMFAVRTNNTLDAMDKDSILRFNLASCGCFLENFVCSLGRIMKWDLQSLQLEDDVGMRQMYAIVFAQHLLGALDFSVDPLHHRFCQVPLGRASSTFMKEYFQRLPAKNVVWYQGS